MRSAHDDHLTAHDLATRAGVLLTELRDSWSGDDPRKLRDAGDRESHEFLMAQLAKICPDDAVLSEEGADDPKRRDADRVWIVDPLDGTREFGEPGRDDWAVHVALWTKQAGGLTAGAVALPARELTLSTAVPAPSDQPARAQGPLIAVSRTRPPDFVAAVVSKVPGAQAVPMGSAGAKVAAVLLGEVDAYLHAGGQYEWDSAAPVAVAQAYGVHASRIDGSPLIYNQFPPNLPDLLVCRKELATVLLDAIAAVRGEGA